LRFRFSSRGFFILLYYSQGWSGVIPKSMSLKYESRVPGLEVVAYQAPQDGMCRI